MISVSNAISLLRQHRSERPVISVPLAESIDAILAEDIQANVTLPPLAASAMDGYAVKLADVRKAGAKLTVIGESPAGHPFQGRVNKGEAVRIFTGGAVPTGADHIVIQENAERKSDTLTILFDNDAPRHIRKAGIDFTTGDTLITKGTRLGPMHIALAAAANHAELPIYKRPIVALIANGDELKAPGSEIGDTDIISSNPAGLGALIRQWGGEVMDMGIADDSIDAITALIRKAKDADIIVPVGGAGNPASATVCAHLFFKILMGAEDELISTKAKLTAPISSNGPRETYLRAFAKISKTGQLEVTPFPRQDSSLLTPLTQANVLIRLPKESGPWDSGDMIDILPLGTGPKLA